MKQWRKSVPPPLPQIKMHSTMENFIVIFALLEKTDKTGYEMQVVSNYRSAHQKKPWGISLWGLKKQAKTDLFQTMLFYKGFRRKIKWNWLSGIFPIWPVLMLFIFTLQFQCGLLYRNISCCSPQRKSRKGVRETFFIQTKRLNKLYTKGWSFSLERDGKRQPRLEPGPPSWGQMQLLLQILFKFL